MQRRNAVALSRIIAAGAVLLLARESEAQYIYGSWENVVVATYNIHHGVGGIDGIYSLERVVGVINQANADIVVVQDVDRRFYDGRSGCDDQVSRLATMLPQYPHQIFEPRLAGRWFLGACGFFQSFEYGILILSKTPLSSYQRVYLENGGESESIPVQHATTNVRGLKVAIYNVHLNTNRNQRQLQAQQLVSFLNATMVGASVAVLGGDFNDTRDATALQPLRDRPLFSNSPAGIVDLVWSSWAFDGYAGYFGSHVESDHELRLHRWWWYRQY